MDELQKNSRTITALLGCKHHDIYMRGELLRLCDRNDQLLTELREDLAVMVGQELITEDQANHIAVVLTKAQNQIIRARARLAYFDKC
jgi:hypothetical protein